MLPFHAVVGGYGWVEALGVVECLTAVTLGVLFLLVGGLNQDKDKDKERRGKEKQGLDQGQTRQGNYESVEGVWLSAKGLVSEGFSAIKSINGYDM